MITERAVAWAMRPKFFGVSSNSDGVAVLVLVDGHDRDAPGLLVDLDAGLLIAPGMLW